MIYFLSPILNCGEGAPHLWDVGGFTFPVIIYDLSKLDDVENKQQRKSSSVQPAL